ncbi:MAG: GAF domain-containing protein [Acidimicrobiales bacterium]
MIALRNGPGLPGDIAARWTTVPVDTATPLGMALRTAATVWAADPVAIAERFPTGADADAAGLRALGAVPVVGAGGRVVAVIGLAWHEPRPLTPELQAALAALAAVVGQAVERAGRFDAERHVAQALAGGAAARRAAAAGHDGADGALPGRRVDAGRRR